jgi:prepilin-type N-terminal cleavage/methylation domain-containing protein
MEQTRGFSLLELLLVLVCMAAIISWAMHHYQVDQRREQTAQVQSDIKSLQRALDTYFHVTGCDQNGNFATTALTVSCTTLQQYDSDLVCSRAPIVVQYSAKMIETDQKTNSIPPKPIYQLEVQAELSSKLSSGQVAWYQQQLRAQSGNVTSTLVWDSLPSNSYVQLGDQSWILNGAGAFFRKTETQRGNGGVTPPQYSGSFCAN